MARSDPRAYVLRDEVREFNRALHSPQPFSAIEWVKRLAIALLLDIGTVTGIRYFFARYVNVLALRSLIPVFGMSLPVLVGLAYYTTIRDMILPRWCSANTINCSWIYLHDSLVTYIITMILYRYASTVWSSPGVALPGDDLQPTWSAVQGQGGFWGLNYSCNHAEEKQRVKLYGELRRTESKAAQDVIEIPSKEATFCKKCNIERPARCHHCSICRRCVLQFDHHCVWVNNCVGYHNYRSFVLLLCSLLFGCLYGVFLLFFVFYEPHMEIIRAEGWKSLFSGGTGILGLPPPIQLIRMFLKGTVDGKIVVDLVYPLVLAVSALMSGFLGVHFNMVLKAHTTLERSIYNKSRVRIWQQNLQNQPSESQKLVNPFDQGALKNIQQVLGPNLWMVFVPRQVKILPPFVPVHHSSEK